jgi:hypothetical protein
LLIINKEKEMHDDIDRRNLRKLCNQTHIQYWDEYDIGNLLLTKIESKINSSYFENLDLEKNDQSTALRFAACLQKLF